MGTALAAMIASGAGAADAPQTVQQRFDAATALGDKGDHAAALAAWQALLAQPKLSARTRGIIRAREGAQLFALDRLDEAASATRAGLAALPDSDRSLDSDRWEAHYNLGLFAQEALDYADAAKQFAAAEGLSNDPNRRIASLLLLARVQTFVDPAAARATLTRLDAAAAGKLAPGYAAAVARTRFIVRINTGDRRGALSAGLDAVKQLGGLTRRTASDDVQARSDTAVAMLLLGRREEARRYMAMTGAGRLPTGQFDPGVEMAPPECGGEAGLKPDDMAVVEFSIRPDGTTVAVVPIYASGSGASALAFAQAARNWSWSPEAVAAMPPFFRNNSRVEMRCSTAFQKPSIIAYINDRTAAWLAGAGAALPAGPDGGAAAAVPRQRETLARARAASRESLQTLAALTALANNVAISRDETALLAIEARAIAVRRAAPPLVRLGYDLQARVEGNLDASRRDTYRTLVTPMLAEPAYAADAEARAALRLLLADRILSDDGNGDRDTEALRFLQQVFEDKALAPTSVFRSAALIQTASIEQRRGKLDAARTHFAQSGVAADQCALIDTPPRMTSMPNGNAFPEEAQAWGFEGWAQMQLDIAADGKTGNVRSLLSYPPFVFTDAAVSVFREARYGKTFRPDGPLGCGGTVQRVRFILP